MVQPVPLHHVNGGHREAPLEICCSNCGTTLGNERAVASSPTGTKYFCKQEPGDNPHDSCYLQWRRRHH